jgi:hypothetical protein
LNLEVDTTIGRGNVKDAAKAAKNYDGQGNVLICWEHGGLVKIAKALGATKYVFWPFEATSFRSSAELESSF